MIESRFGCVAAPEPVEKNEMSSLTRVSGFAC